MLGRLFSASALTVFDNVALIKLSSRRLRLVPYDGVVPPHPEGNAAAVAPAASAPSIHSYSLPDAGLWCGEPSVSRPGTPGITRRSLMPLGGRTLEAGGEGLDHEGHEGARKARKGCAGDGGGPKVVDSLGKVGYTAAVQGDRPGGRSGAMGTILL